MAEKIFVFLVSPFFITWSIWYYWKFTNRKKDKPVNHVQSKPLPPIILNAPPVEHKPPFEIVNRRQRRRMEKIKQQGAKKYAPKKQRDELRAGKIVDANDFLKQYFNDGKK